MPSHQRRRMEPTEDWEQLRFRFTWPEQASYELIRPVVLFGRTPAERAQETGAAVRTIYRKANRFDMLGMTGLFPEEPVRDARVLPPHIRHTILELKAQHAALRPNELATICCIRFGRRPGPHTIQRILAEEPVPLPAPRRFPPYEQIADPTERRLAVVRLHSEGWNIASIAAYLQTSRQTIHTTLSRWIEEGVEGLEDRRPGPKHPIHKADLPAMNAIRKLQVNPELGAFRMHAAMLQPGIKLSPRTCGRILALNRKL